MFEEGLDFIDVDAVGFKLGLDVLLTLETFCVLVALNDCSRTEIEVVLDEDSMFEERERERERKS